MKKLDRSGFFLQRKNIFIGCQGDLIKMEVFFVKRDRKKKE